MDAGKIDYPAIRQRLADAQEALDAGASMESARSVLRSRAEAMSLEGASASPALEGFEAVGFRHGREGYCVESRYVAEVYPLIDPVVIPGTPRFILGIVNLRGRILSVMDLGKLFDLPSRGVGEYDRIIVLKGEGMEFGLLCTEILGVMRISKDSLQPSLPTLTGIREKYLLGVTQDRMAVLAAGRMLSDASLIVREEA